MKPTEPNMSKEPEKAIIAINSPRRIGGRKKGGRNIITRRVKESLADLIDDNMEKLQTDLNNLTSHQRVLVLSKLLKYVIPINQKLHTDIDISKLDNDQIEELYLRVVENQ